MSHSFLGQFTDRNASRCSTSVARWCVAERKLFSSNDDVESERLNNGQFLTQRKSFREEFQHKSVERSHYFAQTSSSKGNVDRLPSIVRLTAVNDVNRRWDTHKIRLVSKKSQFRSLRPRRKFCSSLTPPLPHRRYRRGVIVRIETPPSCRYRRYLCKNARWPIDCSCRISNIISTFIRNDLLRSHRRNVFFSSGKIFVIIEDWVFLFDAPFPIEDRLSTIFFVRLFSLDLRFCRVNKSSNRVSILYHNKLYFQIIDGRFVDDWIENRRQNPWWNPWIDGIDRLIEFNSTWT